MAQQKKKTTTTKKKTTGSSRSSSSGKRTAKKNQKRPIRREVAGAILLVLALCLGFSYFQSGAWLLDQPAKLCRSLFGWGYYLVAPALLLGSYILLLPPWAERRVLPCRHGAAAGRVRRDHAHRPLQREVCQHGWHLEASVDERQRARVRRRGVCIACDHAGAAGEKGAGDDPARCAVRRVFDDGVPLDACRRDRGRALARARAYEPVEEEDLPPQHTHAPRRSAPIHTPDAAIDIPLDGEERVIRKNPTGGFFRKKSDNIKSPDELLAGGSAAETKSAAPVSPAAAPSAPVKPVTVEADDFDLPPFDTTPSASAPVVPAPAPVMHTPFAAPTPSVQSAPGRRSRSSNDGSRRADRQAGGQAPPRRGRCRARGGHARDRGQRRAAPAACISVSAHHALKRGQRDERR